MTLTIFFWLGRIHRRWYASFGRFIHSSRCKSNNKQNYSSLFGLVLFSQLLSIFYACDLAHVYWNCVSIFTIKQVVGDGAMIPGWDAALRTMKLGERAVIRLTDPSLGYGDDPRAAPALLALGADPSNSQLEFDILVQTVQPAAQAAQLFDMNFDAMALEDNTPKTAQEIAEAYQVKMANKAPEKEGLEGWIETVKNYYFFGFFEGETGEEAPWYLKPSITFPIAFAVVGAAFYVSLLTGAISEKGAQSIDELDVIVTNLVPSVPGL